MSAFDPKRTLAVMTPTTNRDINGRWLLLALLVVCGCSSVTDSQTSAPITVTLAQYATHDAVSHVVNLHLLNIQDVPALRASLGQQLSYDVLSLDDLLKHYPISDKERKSAYDTLRLIAVQNEKFPIPGLGDDPKVTAALQAAIANDPAHADALRGLNWSKPMWQR